MCALTSHPLRGFRRALCCVWGQSSTQPVSSSCLRSPAADEWVTLPLLQLSHTQSSSFQLRLSGNSLVSSVSHWLTSDLLFSSLATSSPLYFSVQAAHTRLTGQWQQQQHKGLTGLLCCVQYSGNKACDWIEILKKSVLFKCLLNTFNQTSFLYRVLFCPPVQLVILFLPGCWLKAFIHPIMHCRYQRSHWLRWSFRKSKDKWWLLFWIQPASFSRKMQFLLVSTSTTCFSFVFHNLTLIHFYCIIQFLNITAICHSNEWKFYHTLYCLI